MCEFDKYSEYYDLIYKDKDYKKESDYIKTIIDKYSVNCTKILELGCGTGKHASYLSNYYKIYAIDGSKSMINKALKNSNSNIKFEFGDVRLFRLNKKVDFVISLFHVASYQIAEDDLLQYFNTARIHLNKGGFFIFDCWHGPAVISQKPEKRLKKVENESILLTREAIPSMKINEDKVEVLYDINVINKDSNENYQFNEKHTLRYLFPPKVELLAKLNNFRIIKSGEWLTDKFLSNGTWSVYYILEAL